MHSDRLERIIELKERLLEEKKRLLDRYAAERDAVLGDIERLEGEIEIHYSDLCTKCLDGTEFCSIKEYLEHLGRMKTQALGHKAALERQMTAVRAELYEMFKEIKVLDTLKEKRASAVRRAEGKRHQKLLDAIALRLEIRKT